MCMYITTESTVYIEHDGKTVHVKYTTYADGMKYRTLAAGDSLTVRVHNTLAEASKGIEAAVAGAMALEGKGGNDG